MVEAINTRGDGGSESVFEGAPQYGDAAYDGAGYGESGSHAPVYPGAGPIGSASSVVSSASRAVKNALSSSVRLIGSLRGKYKARVSQTWISENFNQEAAQAGISAANMDSNTGANTGGNPYANTDTNPYTGPPKPPFAWARSGYITAMSLRDFVTWRMMLFPGTIIVCTLMWFGFVHQPIITEVSLNIHPKMIVSGSSSGAGDQ